MKIRRILIVGTLVPALCPAQSVFDGVWRPDPEIPGEPNKPEVSVPADGLYACKTCDPTYQVKADGHDQVLKGNPNADSVNVSIVDDRTVMKTVKIQGTTFATRISVSAHGSESRQGGENHALDDGSRRQDPAHAV